MKKINIKNIILVLIPVLFIFSGVSDANTYEYSISDSCPPFDCGQSGLNVYLMAHLIPEYQPLLPAGSGIHAHLLLWNSVYPSGYEDNINPINFANHSFLNTPTAFCVPTPCSNTPIMTDGVNSYSFLAATPTILMNFPGFSSFSYINLEILNPLPNSTQNYTMSLDGVFEIPYLNGTRNINIEEFGSFLIPYTNLSPSIFSK